ncbi:MAG: hypothetical protein U0133_06155 [Gemmatimonadales bacterium]
MVFQTGISRLGSFENTPIVVDNMMYVTTPYNSRDRLRPQHRCYVWRYEHKLGTTIYCCGPNNRRHGGARPPRLHGHPRRAPDRLDRMIGEVAWTSRWPIPLLATASPTPC